MAQSEHTVPLVVPKSDGLAGSAIQRFRPLIEDLRGRSSVMLVTAGAVATLVWNVLLLWGLFELCRWTLG